ncbi:hypothetical protein J1605_007938 [Eschrichtius robustus]|uniref:Uncharacterized protein n=1 Tax=Eschrichtius robustus TaxID=9764 RepID=A0AB34GZL1_ESCRO|nr:hypothetical protein J1605_007938 [Eschrichtius robustus]
MELLRPPGPLRTHLAGGTAPGGDTTVKPAPGVARGAARVPRLRDGAGQCRAGATRAEPGTVFARAEEEAGAFGGLDRGNPETPGPHRAGGRDGGGSRCRCASGVAGDPAGAAAWGPGGAEPPPPVRAACRAAREVSLARSWAAAGTGRPVTAAPARAVM